MVVPSRQRAHAVRLAHAARQLSQGLKVWPSADVLPLDGWLTREIERGARREGEQPRLLTVAEEWVLWRQCTAERAEHLQLLNGAGLARDLHQAYRLASELQLDFQAVRAAPGTETALFLAVVRAVEDRSRDLGAASAAAILSRIHAAGGASGAAVGDARPVLFTGFLEGSPRLRAFANARQARGWPTHGPSLEAGKTTPTVVLAADEIEELDRIAEWCGHRLANHPGDRLLIVLPGAPGRRERLAALIGQALDPQGAFAGTEPSGRWVAIEGGGALSGQPLVAQALGGLALLCGEALTPERLTPWLLSPFWAQPTLEERSRLELWLREHTGLTLDPAALRRALETAPGPLQAAARSCLERLEQAGSALRDSAGSPREWSERFRGALERLGWPGTRSRSSLEQQTLLRWHALLDEFGQLSAMLGTLGKDAAFAHLRALSSETAYRPADEDAAITVTSSLADPVVRYDGLWVAGLHAEVLPQPVAPDPFIPLRAQLGSAAASAAGRLGEAQALLAAWRSATEELVLSTPRRSGDLDLLPSPLLSLGSGAVQATALPRHEPVWLALRAHRAQRCEFWEDQGLPWDIRQRLPSGTRTIELQNDCPFRAYAQLRLGCTELQPSEPGVPADFRGRLLHLALQRLWSSLHDSRALVSLAPAELEERVAECTGQALEQLLADERAPPSAPAIARERRRTQRLIRRLLDLERQRPPFTVQHTEYGARIDLEGIRLDVRMDRIDQLEGGGLAILDYKSGQAVPGDWYGERPSHPQLLTYLMPFDAQVVALATVNVTARKVEFQGITAQAGLLPKVSAVRAAAAGDEAWPRQLRAWRDVVQRLARDFAGVASLDPKPKACQYCPVTSVCRIGEAAGIADEGESE